MKVIIAGSRTINDERILWEAIKEAPFNITEIVCGMAKGVDMLGHIYGYCNDLDVSEFPANWDQHGKSAGYKRNVQMGEYADALIAIWDGQSKGTKHMIDIMTKLNKPVSIYYV